MDAKGPDGVAQFELFVENRGMSGSFNAGGSKSEQPSAVGRYPILLPLVSIFMARKNVRPGGTTPARIKLPRSVAGRILLGMVPALVLVVAVELVFRVARLGEPAFRSQGLPEEKVGLL